MPSLILSADQVESLSWQPKWIRNRGSDLCELRDAMQALGMQRGVETIEQVQNGLAEIAAEIAAILITAGRNNLDGDAA